MRINTDYLQQVQVIGSGGLNPLAISDFANGIYSINGVPKTLAEMWTQDLRWNAFNPLLVVPGVGYSVSSLALGDTSDGPVATAPLVAAVGVPGGFIAVVDYTLTQAGTAHCLVQIDEFVLPGYAVGLSWTDDPHAAAKQNSVADFAAVIEGIEPGSYGVKKTAFLFDTSVLAVSVNGSAVVETGAPEDFSASNMVGLYLLVTSNGADIGTVTVRSITFYPTADPSVLSALSA